MNNSFTLSSKVIIHIISLFLTISFISTQLNAANYGVSPLSVTFDKDNKSSVFTVSNDDKKSISLRIEAMNWIQNNEGNESYEKTKDLIFFPKRLELAPGEKRIVRVGVRNTEVGVEKAYRLYIEELPPAQLEGDGSTKLAVLVTFGLPVFIKPSGVESKLRLMESSIDGNSLSLHLTNSGKSHSRLSRLVTEEGLLLSENLPGRYLHPGVSRRISIPLPLELCDGKSHTIRIEAQNEALTTKLRLPVSCNS